MRFVKTYLLTTFLILNFGFCFAQKYGNEWVSLNKTYVKFPIVREGIYRIDSATLASKFNLQTLNPNQLQLFVLGKEQALFIEGASDGKINTNDYIEFYATHLRREFDSLLYAQIQYIPNPYLPLFNDTLFGYITVNTHTNNSRYAIETDSTIANYPITPYYYTQLFHAPLSHYNVVKDVLNTASDPRFTQAEGPGFIFNKGSSVSTNFSLIVPFTASALPCHFEVVYAGFDMNLSQPIDKQVQINYVNNSSNTIILHDTLLYGYAPVKKTFTINSNNLNSGSSFAITSVNNPSFTTNNITILHYMQLIYPRIANLGGIASHNMILPDESSSTKQSFVLANPNAGSTNSIVAYDITNKKKIPVHLLGGNARMVVPNSGGMKKIYLCAESAINQVTQLRDVMNGGNFSNFKTGTPDSAFVIVYHPKLQSSATAYKNYRQSTGGGNHKVIMADVTELYDHFGYGINKHPQALRNFFRYLHDSLNTPPRYVLLIGKGVNYLNLSGNQHHNLVPTMGIPSSDNLLTAGITNSIGAYQEIPIGRIAAIDNQEVTTYLSKIQQHEAIGTAEWKKRVLHFVGGDDQILANQLSNLMYSYEMLIEDTLFGGEVLTFKKNTTAPIQVNISDSIKEAIKNGASLLTFFGHGSNQSFDQSIDDPSAYNNTGKYPFMYANSCYSGDIFIPGNQSVSERFVFANQRGSIGFLAATNLGYVMPLHYYALRFYRALSVTQYGKGIGDVIKEAAKESAAYFDKLTRYTALDMALHGDPSVKIYTAKLPDYEIKNNYVKFNTKKYTDSIGLNIRYFNLGKAINDTIVIYVERMFPNGDSTSFLKKVKAAYFKDSISFFIPLDFVRGIGLNKFKVRLDYFNKVNEVTKNNNATIGTVDLFIQGGDIVPVYPYKYAVIPLTGSITLKASTSDPFAPQSTYRLQLDTCDNFTAPIQQTLVTSSGGVIEWNVTLPFADSTVYFWRVAKDSSSPSDRMVWRESSFQTIGTKTGWSQTHFHQFKNNTYRFVSFNRQQRKFDFNNTLHSIFTRTGIFPHISWANINYFYNNINMSTWGCAPNGWNFAIFDSISGEPDAVVSINFPNSGPGTYSNCVCVDNQVLRVYSFGAGNYCGFGNWQNSMETFLNSIPQNNYVLAYSIGAGGNNSEYSSYSPSLYNAFESIGAGSIRRIKDSLSYIIFGRKGMKAGEAHETVGLQKTSIITQQDTIRTRWNSGFIASEIIGPSYKWNSLHWQLKPYDLLPGDTTVLKVVGIKSNGQKDTLASFTKDSTDILALYNYADANTYPYLQLVAHMKDNINRTSPQLRKWQVLYDQAPECAINPLKGYVAINDSLMEGDIAKFRIPIENIGKLPFNDSLVITYWLEDNNKIIHPLPQKLKRNNFLPGEVIFDTISLNSFQYRGNNAFWIYVNPISNARYQKEQEQFNNIARMPFKVQKDITNPLLDVTFDGVRILNGDIVSAKPTILITLKDENKFLALNDTGAFTVRLKYPGQSTFTPLYFANQLQFTPANLPNNSCKIDFNPTLHQDGMYQLNVQAKDRSQNRSGSNEYNIQFEVKNKSTVTNVLNYPNPFSTSTRFVFTLTGSEIPDVFTIQIMTVSGKVVREITKNELGPIRIGRNITEYAWDGKDEFGDKLGNGVYLYKVITRLNNDFIEKSETSADKYFVKEFGKMVIMR